MTENIKPKRKRTSHPDRVTLDQEAFIKVNSWIEQVNDRFKSIIKVNRSDIVNLVLKNYVDQLSVKDLKLVKATYFDDVKFAQWVAKELQTKKSNGEKVSYEQVVASVRPLLDFPTSKRKRSKTEKNENIIINRGETKTMKKNNTSYNNLD